MTMVGTSGWQNIEHLQKIGVWAFFFFSLVAAGKHTKCVSRSRKNKGSGEKA